MEPITVAITTYNRVDVLKETLLRFHENLKYSGEVRYVIGNDGDIGEVLKMAHSLPFWASGVNTIAGGAERQGLGVNCNRMLRVCETDIVLQSQDDYQLLKPLDLDQHVRALRDNPEIGWVRLKLLNGQDFMATVQGQYWHVSPFSTSQYIASDQPHLKHVRRFHDHYGWYSEGLPVIQTENEWCSRVKERMQRDELTGQPGPKVVIPLENHHDSGWRHVCDGELSWAAKGF